MMKLLRIISTFVLTIMFLAAFCQKGSASLHIDSLKNSIKVASYSDTAKARTLFNIAEFYYENGKNDSAKVYSKQAETILSRYLNKRNNDDQLLLLARIYHLNGSLALVNGKDISIPLLHYQNSLKLYKEAEDSKGISDLLRAITYLYTREGDSIKLEKSISKVRYFLNNTDNLAAQSELQKTLSQYMYYKTDMDSALYFLNQSLQIDKSRANKKGVAYCIGNLGTYYRRTGQYDSALFYALDGLKFCKANNYQKGEMFILISIGGLYIVMKKWEQSLPFLKSAQEITRKRSNVQAEIMVSDYLGRSYSQLNNHDSAVLNFQNVLKLIEENNYGHQFESDVYNRISVLYRNKSNLNLALEYAKKSIGSHRNNAPWSKAPKTYNLGAIYFKMGKLTLAQKFISQSYSAYKNSKDKQGVISASLMLSDVYTKKGQYKLAMDYLKESQDMQNSLYNEKTEKLLAESESKFNAQKKEFELENKKKEIILLKKDSRIRNFTIYGFILILFIGILSFMNFYGRKKAKETKSREQILHQLNQIEQLNTVINSLKESPVIENQIEVKVFEINNVLDTPLSERELEVLANLSLGLSNKAMAEKLFVSVNTINTHVKSIYTKLDVHNRTQATLKLTELRKEV